MSTLTSELNIIQNEIVNYYLPIIFLIGLFGNIANIMIFRRGRLKGNVCSWYFICLSITQTVLLFFNGLYRIIGIGWDNGYDLTQTSADLCKFRVYGYLYSVAASRHFLCLISLDRWMKTSYSVSLRAKSSPKYARGLIGFGFIFWLLYELHVPIGYPKTLVNGCIPVPGSAYQLFYSISSIIIGIGPMLIMIISSMMIRNNLRKQGRVIHPISSKIQTNVNDLSLRRSRTDFQLIRLSLIQIIFFLIFNWMTSIFPLYIFLTASQVKDADRRAIETFITNTGQYLLTTYAALTFILYTLASSVFRQEAKEYFISIKQYFVHIFHNF